MQLLVNIVVLGSIYALIACGYVLIYRVSRVLNLAHGELMMLGAYLVLATASLFNGEPVMALGAAILLSLVVGGLVYVFLMRKMTGEMVLAAILTTVALGILIRGAGRAGLVGAAAISRAGARRAQPLARVISRRAHLAVVGGPGGHQCRRLRRAVLLPALRPLGHAHARRRTESSARCPARHQPARCLCAGLEPIDAHRRASPAS